MADGNADGGGSFRTGHHQWPVGTEALSFSGTLAAKDEPRSGKLEEASRVCRGPPQDAPHAFRGVIRQFTPKSALKRKSAIQRLGCG